MGKKYNYLELTRRILDDFKTIEEFASEIGFSKDILNEKLNNKVDFNSNEINKIIDILDISNNHIQNYFFKIKVSLF